MTFPAPGLRRSRPRSGRAARPLVLEVLEDRSLLSVGPAPSVIDLSGLAVNTAQYSTADILVRFNPSALTGGAVPALAGTSVGRQLPLVQGLYTIDLGAGVTAARALAEYRADPRVLEADPDFALTTSAVPDDPMFNQQWALQNTGQGGGTAGDDIHATQAWNVTTGSGQTVVAVMDTGIDYNHPDLYQNIWINQAEIPKSRLAPSLGGTNPNGIQDYYHDGYVSWRDLNDPRNIGPGKITDVNGDGVIDAGDILAPMVLNAQGQDAGQGGWSYAGNTQDGDTAHPDDFIGWNFVTNTNNPFDDNGHGTHVSGIIGAQGNNGVGVAGVDWQVGLMPVKFLNSTGNGSISAVIDGLNYAVAHGAKISNNSWSGAGNVQILSDAINNARSAGMIFVAAAGNGGNNNDATPAYPSSFPLDNIVSVAASDANNNLASFSNYGGNSVDLAAPGVNILSTLPNKGYGTLSGTSMAAPMVTGVLALVWSEHPGWTYQQVIRQVLSTVTPVPALQGKLASGGVLNAAAAVGVGTSGPLQVTASTAGGAAGTFDNILVTFSAPVDPSTLNNTNVALLGPGGQRVLVQSFRAVSGSGGDEVDLVFPSQTAPGTYRLYVAAGVRSVTGAALPSTYQNSFQLSGVYTVASTSALGIPDVSQTVALLTVDRSFTVGSVTVQMNIVNSVDGTLDVRLVAPDGTVVALSVLRGGTGVGFGNTVFSDQASASVKTGQAPFAGSYQPETPLAALSGKNAQGVWKLWVQDHGTNYYVTLTGWSLTFTASAGNVQITDVAPAAAAPPPAVPGAAAASSLAGALPQLRDAAPAFGAAQAIVLSQTAVAPPAGIGGPTPVPRADEPRTAAADGVFASADGVDRLAELRVVVPHAARPAGDGEAAADPEGEDVEVAADVAAEEG